MTWAGPGFVDHHTHLLQVAAGVPAPYGDPPTPESVAAYHRSVLDRWSTPMDEPHKPLVVDDGLRGAVERHLDRAAAHGLVQITEAGMVDWAFLDVLRDLRTRGPLAVRVRLLIASGIADVDRMARIGDPWVEVVGVKFYADGWLGPRTCAMCSPFADVDDAGVLFLDADTLARRMDPFAEAGWTIATHAIGDRAIESCLDAYEKVYGGDCPAAAPRIEHAQILDSDLVERMARLGVVACIQPGFAVSDAGHARAALGDRLELAYRWDVLLDAGVPVIAGSDFPIESLRPLVGLQRLVTGAPEQVGARPVAPTLELDRALAVMTDEAAGTTTLSEDPHDVEPDGIHRIEVVGTEPSGS